MRRIFRRSMRREIIVSIDDVEGSDRNHKHNKTPSMRKEKLIGGFLLGLGTAGGGHLSCKEEIRSVQFR